MLYSDPLDPASHAVRFVLAEKAINIEIIQVTPDDKPEDLNDLNPYNDVLTLVDRDLVLYEPQIMMEYLDERFPHPPLMPVDPVSRAPGRTRGDMVVAIPATAAATMGTARLLMSPAVPPTRTLTLASSPASTELRLPRSSWRRHLG